MTARCCLLAVLLMTACAPPTVIGDDGARRGARDDDDDDDGDEGEGDGGEGEVDDLPPDVPPDPQGPHIESFSISSSRIDDGDVAVITVVVSDPDGVADIIGPVLVDARDPSRVLGTLSSPAAGTFTGEVRFSTFDDVDPVEFTRGGDSRFVRVAFNDIAGHQVTHTQRIDLFCAGDLPACDGRCGSLRCQDDCLDDVNAAPTADQLCMGCNAECPSDPAAGDVCFSGDPDCGASADCLLRVNLDTRRTDLAICVDDGGVVHRDDGTVAWVLDGVAVSVDFISGEDDTFAADLCADFGGAADVVRVPVPNDVDDSLVVIGFAVACAGNLDNCRPVFARPTSTAFTMQVSCVEPRNGEGTVGHSCFNDACSDGTVCRDGNCEDTCVEDACEICDAAFGSCACTSLNDDAFVICESPLQENRGGMLERCRAISPSTACDDDGALCFNGVCSLFCQSDADCDACDDASGRDCTCSNNVCAAAG